MGGSPEGADTAGCPGPRRGLPAVFPVRPPPPSAPNRTPAGRRIGHCDRIHNPASARPLAARGRSPSQTSARDSGRGQGARSQANRWIRRDLATRRSARRPARGPNGLLPRAARPSRGAGGCWILNARCSALPTADFFPLFPSTLVPRPSREAGVPRRSRPWLTSSREPRRGGIAQPRRLMWQVKVCFLCSGLPASRRSAGCGGG